MYYNDTKKMLKKLKIIEQNQSVGTDCETNQILSRETDSLYHHNVPRININYVQNSFQSNNTTIQAHQLDINL